MREDGRVDHFDSEVKGRAWPEGLEPGPDSRIVRDSSLLRRDVVAHGSDAVT